MPSITETDQYGNTITGHYDDEIILDNESNPIKTGKKIWVQDTAKKQDLPSLGANYETDGPSNAPKVLALIYLSPAKDTFNFAFYVLDKVNVDASERHYQYGEESESQSVVRWKYFCAFDKNFVVWLRQSEDEILDSINKRFKQKSGEGVDVVDFVPKIFSREAAHSLKIDFNRTIAIIAFDKMEHDFTIVELKQLSKNISNGYFTVPLKLTNPRCIYVNSDNIRTNVNTDAINKLTREEMPVETKSKLESEKKELTVKYDRQVEANKKHKQMKNEIEAIRVKRETEINKIKSQSAPWNRTKTSQEKINASAADAYKGTADYLKDESLIMEYEKQMQTDDKNTSTLNTALQSVLANIDSGNTSSDIFETAVYDRTDPPSPTYFVSDPQFTLKELITLVRTEYLKSQKDQKGGRKHKSHKSKKSMKVKKRYIHSRKHTKKYRRRSYR
jgi:hypothetical protein